MNIAMIYAYEKRDNPGIVSFFGWMCGCLVIS